MIALAMVSAAALLLQSAAADVLEPDEGGSGWEPCATENIFGSVLGFPVSKENSFSGASGLVYHLTGDLDADIKEAIAAGSDMDGFLEIPAGHTGAGLKAGPRPWKSPADEESKSSSVSGGISELDIGPVFCLEFWVRTPVGGKWIADFGERQVFLYGVGDGAVNTMISLTEGRRLQHPDFEIVVLDNFPPGEWNHVALAVDFGTTMTKRLVINGETKARKQYPDANHIRGAGSRLWLKPLLEAFHSDPNANLVFDDIRLYDRFVSTAELQSRYKREKLAGERALAKSEGAAKGEGPGERAIHATTLTGELWSQGQLDHVLSHPPSPESSGSLQWTPAQWSQDQPGELWPYLINGATSPIPRTCHTVVGIGGGKLLMFGGELRDTHVGGMANGDDMWIYHMKDMRWERVGGGATDRTGRETRDRVLGAEAEYEEQFPDGPRFDLGREQLLEIWGAAPEPRCHQGMAFDPVTGNAFLLSGWANENEGDISYPDAWIFDTNTNTWIEQAQDQHVPPITDISAVYHAGRGRFLFMTRDVVLSMDADGGELAQDARPAFVDESFAPVTPRTPVQAMTWYDPDTELVLRFGGFHITPPEGERTEPILERANSMYVYSAEHSAWVQRAAPEGTLVPSPRVRGAVAYDTKNDCSVLFGGITGGLDSRANDLWIYETASGIWSEVQAAGAPGKRGGYFGMAYDEGLDAFVVPFGRQDTETFLDEVWRLELRPNESGVASYLFDRSEWEAGLRLDWEWTGKRPRFYSMPSGCFTWEFPDEYGPSFEVRAAEDGAPQGDWQPISTRARVRNAAGELPPGRFLEVRVTVPPGCGVTRLEFL